MFPAEQVQVRATDPGHRRQLDWLRLRLIQLEEQKSRFLRHVSHELKTPLHAVVSFAHLGEERCQADTAIPPRIGQYFSRISGAATRLEELIHSLLDLSGLVDDAGEPLGLDPVGLYPLSTNSNTAQGESGDFYFDEFFWTVGFAQLRKVAAAMATHTIYKRTYFSTPSTKTHEAYAFWSGEEWNRGRPKG